MAFTIDWSYETDADLDWISDRYGKRHEVVAIEGVDLYLEHQADQPSRRRKQMGPNSLGATWELRLAELRVYYDIDRDQQTVTILRIGMKDRNRVFIRGEEIDLRAQ